MLSAIGAAPTAPSSLTPERVGSSPREAAQLLASELLFKPMLEEMRKTPFGKGLLGEGRAEEVFNERFDEQLADAAAKGSPGLTQQLERYFRDTARSTPAALGENGGAAVKQTSNDSKDQR